MALKTVITQKQKLSLTTHMQLSLELLQMDSIALKEKIETELERNPILEEKLTPDLSQAETPTIQWSDDIPDHNFSENSYLDIADYPANMPLSLSDYLLEQLENTSISQELFPVVQYLIFNLDSNGWLHLPPKAISQELHLPLNKTQSAIQIIQALDPAGVGALDYKDCLLIQAYRKGLSQTALKILHSDSCLKLLSNNQYNKISNMLNVSIPTVIEANREILTLDPKPCSRFGNFAPLYIMPDAYINTEDNKFSITIGNPYVPDVQINAEYHEMLQNSSNPEVIEYLDNCLKNAQSLINGIQQRNRTLLLCISEIVRQQSEYFKNGNGYLRPMTLQDIATTLDMNVSTISRATKNKYIACCHGILPLGSLFTSGIQQNENSENVSSTKIQALIKDLIKKEDKSRPLSDPEIAKILSDEGYQIARRTVSKYRLSLNIPSASQRKFSNLI
jgi:RNA polymerase sigma-54 factor